MFTNLIESNADRSAFKRRSSFFLITIAAYCLILLAAGVAGVLTYDATVEAQKNDLSLLNWIPPVKETVHAEPVHETHAPRKFPPSNAPIDRHISTPVRTDSVASAADPTKVPNKVGTQGTEIPPTVGPVEIGDHNANPPTDPNAGDKGCTSCNATPATPVARTPPPAPTPMPPTTTEHLPTNLLISKALSLPQPPYPMIAKQTRTQGAVNVQILIDEHGKVISAHAVAGNAMLVRAAEEAATRARFTPTKLNDQPVKVQGVITYNFVLQ